MNKNIAFQKAIRHLSAPVSLIAILLLLLNDHLLRQFWPSWLTGKLGDFAWLFIFPFALAALLAWLVPARLDRQVQITGFLAFGGTGLIFSLAKCNPACNALVNQVASLALGIPVNWRLDPSDLLALVALLAGWLLWQHTLVPLPNQAVQKPRLAWLLLTSTALLTVANSIQPQTGIGCLSLVENQVQACSSFNCYTSLDGGLSWAESVEFGAAQLYCIALHSDPPEELTIQDPADASIQYRAQPGVAIERSADGGQTWQQEFALHPIRQAEQAYYYKTSGGNAVVLTPPLDALADPVSGNLIFAMGHAGVLVRQADGEYARVAVGEFSAEPPSFGHMLTIVLEGESLLALALGGLGAAMLGAPQKQHWLRKMSLTLGWLAWGITSLFFPPALAEGAYSALVPAAGALVASVLALILAAEALVRIGAQDKQQALHLAMILLSSTILYFTPFVFWLWNVLPVYTLALVLGLALAIGWLLFNKKRWTRLT